MTYINDNTVVCIFEDILTSDEDARIAAGGAAGVIDVRHRAMDAIRRNRTRERWQADEDSADEHASPGDIADDAVVRDEAQQL